MTRRPRPTLFAILLATLGLALLLAPLAAERVEGVLLGGPGQVRVVYTRPEVVAIESNGSDALGGAFVSRRAQLNVTSDGSIVGCTVGVYCYQGGRLLNACIVRLNVTLYDRDGNVLAYNTSAAIVPAGYYAEVNVPFNGSVKVWEVYALVVESGG